LRRDEEPPLAVVVLLGVFPEERPLLLLLVSIIAVAKEDDFLRASLAFAFALASRAVLSLGLGVGASALLLPAVLLLLLLFPADADAEPEADVLGLLSHALRAARPRTSPASSAADFFLVLSSSEDLLEDMIVSSVPYAVLLRCRPFRLLGWDRDDASSSEGMACRVGPPEPWPWLRLRLWPFLRGTEEGDGPAPDMKEAPELWGATWTSYWLLREYRERAHISAMRSRSALMSLSPPGACRSAMKLLNENASSGGSLGSSGSWRECHRHGRGSLLLLAVAFFGL
jgi:hypothetical protein